jgi:VanZ family protein
VTSLRSCDAPQSPPRAVRLLCAAAYTALVIYGSLVPLEFEPLPIETAIDRFKHTQDFDIPIYGRADLVANLVLYVPVGLLIAWSAGPRRRSALLSCLAVLFAGVASAALAIGVEFIQLWFPARTVSLNDLRAEVVGGTVGALSYLPARYLGRTFSLEAIVKHWSVTRAGVLYVAGMVAFSLLPGDFVLSLEEFRQKLSSERVALIPLTDTGRDAMSLLKLALHVASYVPIGYWLSHVARRTAARNSFRAAASVRAVLGGAGIALFVEILQLAVFSRYSSSTSVLTGVLGTMVGVLVHFVATQDAKRRPRWLQWFAARLATPTAWWVAVMLLSAAISALMLAPFRLATSEQRVERWKCFRNPPFAAMYVGQEFAALTNVLHKGLPFFALGMAIAQATHLQGTSSTVKVVALGTTYAAILGTCIEVAQVYVDVHLPDGTDVLIYAFSTGVGAGGVCYVRSMRRRLTHDSTKGVPCP